MSGKTIFSKIIDGEIPAKIEYQDDSCIVIHDISPKAPVHLLIIPKTVIPRVAEATGDQAAILGQLLLIAGEMSRKLNLAKGFRLIINNGPHGGEEVPHLHIHLLGGRQLGWPPG